MDIGIEDIIRNIQQETMMPCIVARQNYLSMLEYSLENNLNSLNNCEEVKEKFEFLSKISQERIVKAPLTYHALLRQINYDKIKPESFFLSFIENAIKVESALEGRNTYFDQPTWSALGDVYLPKGEHSLPASESEYSVFNPEKIFVAKKLHKIIIDGHSPWITQEFRLGDICYNPGAYLKLCPVEKYNNVLSKIDEALNILKEHAKGFYFLVLTNVSVIQVAINIECGFLSESYGTKVGLVNINNAHKKNIDTADIIDALVHEAIHNFLFCFNQKTPLLLKIKNKNTDPVISPWTGNKLPLFNYIHACFVWWGLFNLWKSIIDHVPSGISKSAHTLLEKAEKGFSSEIVYTNIYPYKDQINPEFYHWILKIPTVAHSDREIYKWA